MPAIDRRVLILEDQPDTRAWLALMVATALAPTALDLVADLRAARQWLADLDPEEEAPLALIDLGLPDGSGISFISELLAKRPRATVVVATIFDDDAHLLAAIAAGAQGYLLKDQDAARLGDRLCAMEAGEPAISPSIARRILQQFRDTAQFRAGRHDEVVLTSRETEVLGLIGRGLTLAEAAGPLGVSRHTLQGYVKTIYRKLGVASRAEAAVEAVRRNLV